MTETSSGALSPIFIVVEVNYSVVGIIGMRQHFARSVERRVIVVVATVEADLQVRIICRRRNLKTRLVRPILYHAFHPVQFKGPYTLNSFLVPVAGASQLAPVN